MVTTEPDLEETSADYGFWTVIIPLAAVLVFIGFRIIKFKKTAARNIPYMRKDEEDIPLAYSFK